MGLRGLAKSLRKSETPPGGGHGHGLAAKNSIMADDPQNTRIRLVVIEAGVLTGILCGQDGVIAVEVNGQLDEFEELLLNEHYVDAAGREWFPQNVLRPPCIAARGRQAEQAHAGSGARRHHQLVWRHSMGGPDRV
jgi:hypothetical protein